MISMCIVSISINWLLRPERRPCQPKPAQVDEFSNADVVTGWKVYLKQWYDIEYLTLASRVNPPELQLTTDINEFHRDGFGIRITTVYCFLQGKDMTLCKAICIVSGFKASLTFRRPSFWTCREEKMCKLLSWKKGRLTNKCYSDTSYKHMPMMIICSASQQIQKTSHYLEGGSNISRINSWLVAPQNSIQPIVIFLQYVKEYDYL
jgi:hypothetical protein